MQRFKSRAQFCNFSHELALIKQALTHCFETIGMSEDDLCRCYMIRYTFYFLFTIIVDTLGQKYATSVFPLLVFAVFDNMQAVLTFTFLNPNLTHVIRIQYNLPEILNFISCNVISDADGKNTFKILPPF